MKQDLEGIVKVVYEANRAYCETLGDYSQAPWASAQMHAKDTISDGVEARIKNPNITPEESHQSWWDWKIRQGWVYGPIKDPEKKEHPCMVPYDELPVEQQVKDYLFLAIVGILLKGTGR